MTKIAVDGIVGTWTEVGIVLKCTRCWYIRKSGWYHPKARATTIPEARRWIEGHEHGFLSEQDARAACSRAAHLRRLEKAP